MPIDPLLHMGNTQPGEYLKRGTGSDANTIISDSGPSGGGGGSGSGDAIENSGQTANLTVNSDDTVTTNADSLALTADSAPLILTDEASGTHSITVDSTPQLLLDGTPISSGGASGDPVLPVNPSNPTHGQQRLKDGVYQVYVQDEWVDQVTAEFWLGDKSPYLSLIPEDISHWTEYTPGPVINGEGYDKPANTGDKLIHGNTHSFSLHIMLHRAMRIQGIQFRTNNSNNSPSSSFEIEGSNDLDNWTLLRTIPDGRMFAQGDDGLAFGSDRVTYFIEDSGNTYRFLRITSSTNASGSSSEIHDLTVKALGRSDTDTHSYRFNTHPKIYGQVVPTMAIFDGTDNDLTKLTSGHGFTTGLKWANAQALTNSDYIEIQLDAPADVSAMCYFQSNDETHGVWEVQAFNGFVFQTVADNVTLGGSKFQIIPFTTEVNTAVIKIVPKTQAGNTTGTPSDIYGLAFAEANKASFSYVGGDRTGSWTITSDVNFTNGSAANLINTYSTTQDTYFTASQAAASKHITIEIPAAKVINTLRFRQQTSTTHGVWDIETSTNGSTWVTRASNITLGGDPDSVYALTIDQTAYSFIRLVGVSGTMSNSPWIYDIDISVT